MEQSSSKRDTSLFLERAAHPSDRRGELVRVGGEVDRENGISKKFAIPEHQEKVYNHLSKIVTISDSKVEKDIFTTGNNGYTFIIKKHASNRQLNQLYRFYIRETTGNPMILAPTYSWFDRIEIAPTLGDEMVWRLYGDSIEEIVRLGGTDEEMKTLGRCANFNSSTDTLFNGVAQTHNANETKAYDLPFHSILEKIGFNPNFLETDIQVKFYGKNGIVVSGTGSPELVKVEMIAEVDEDNHHVKHADDESKQLLMSVPRYDFYEGMKAYNKTVSLTALGETSIDLDDLKGHVAFLTIRIRSSRAIANNAAFINQDLGPDAIIDVTDENGKTIWSNGIYADYALLHQTRKWFPNDFCARSYIYVVSFCDNPHDAMYHGVTHGYLRCNKDKKLRIKPGAAPTTWQFSVNLSNSSDNDGGSISFSDPLGNHTGALAFNATASAVGAAISALPFFALNGLTVTASATPVNDFVLTVSGRDLSLMENKTIGVHSKLMQSTNVTNVTSVTCSRVARRGFVSGDYLVDVYGWVHKKVANMGRTLMLA